MRLHKNNKLKDVTKWLLRTIINFRFVRWSHVDLFDIFNLPTVTTIPVGTFSKWVVGDGCILIGSYIYGNIKDR